MGFADKVFKKKTVVLQEAEKGNMPQAKSKAMLYSEQRAKSQLKRGWVSVDKMQADHTTIQELKNRFIAFDAETTGLSPKNHKIIEFAAVLFENGEITKKYGTLVNPEVSIPYSATAINHITNEMIQYAPKEELVYAELVDFLGDALNQQTAICAHNASFDMKFLSETLMRLGYNGKIRYVDTLSLSRNLIKGLYNYKQDTVAMHFGLVNSQSHRAASDAEICGRIFWNLLKIKEKEQDKILKRLEKSKLCEEELEVCAYIQDCIVKHGGDTKWLGFYKNSSSYIEVSYLYSVVKFKFAKKGKYIVVEKSALSGNDHKIEPCTMSEGGAEYIRLYFDHPFELEPLGSYFYKMYDRCRKSALDYFKYHKHYESEHKKSPAMLNSLSDSDAAVLLKAAEKRKNEEYRIDTDADTRSADVKTQISREDVTIHPVHNRVPLSNIRNKDNWEKGFDEGYPLWEEGDSLRKKGDLESAIHLFEQARYNGYDAPALYNSYAMAYRKLKDYDNEIDILDEGIERERKQYVDVGKLAARRDKAVQLLLKQQETGKKNQKA